VSSQSSSSAVASQLSTAVRQSSSASISQFSSSTTESHSLSTAAESHSPSSASDRDPVVFTSTVLIDELQSSIQSHRKRAREGLTKQAERMIKRSKIVLALGDHGDNVSIPIPLVDRGRGDPRNILGVILDRDINDMYRIAVRAGVLCGRYSRNQFDLCAYRLLTLEDVCADKEVTLRAAVQSESKCGGQGFVKCNCKGTDKCKSNRCKCFKAKLQCNSRCHSSLSCCNKTNNC
jgi:hypothetical protein